MQRCCQLRLVVTGGKEDSGNESKDPIFAILFLPERFGAIRDLLRISVAALKRDGKKDTVLPRAAMMGLLETTEVLSWFLGANTVTKCVTGLPWKPDRLRWSRSIKDNHANSRYETR